MPFEVLSIFEGLAQVALLWPTNHAAKYKKQTAAIVLELLAAAEGAISSLPNGLEEAEVQRFILAKDKLVGLNSNAPMLGMPLHEALKPIMTEALAISRAFRVGAADRHHVEMFIKRLQKHYAEQHDT